MPAGDKYYMYIADSAATQIVSSHDMFGNLDTPGNCQSASLASECASAVKWTKSTTIAFLDAFVLGDTKAKRWMKGKRLARASGDIATVQSK